MSRHSLKTALVLAQVPAFACTGDPQAPMVDDTAPVATRLEVVSGDGQIQKPDRALRDPLVVQLANGSGPQAKAGVPVTWIVRDGGGVTSQSTVQTDANGQASAEWTLGSNEGIQRVDAVAQGSLIVEFHARSVDQLRQIVYSRGPSYGGPWDIYMIEPDGSGRVQITRTPYRDSWPAWSPDGRKLVFIRRYNTRCSADNGDLVVIDFDAMIETRITEFDRCVGLVNGSSWSPDGTKLVFSLYEEFISVSLLEEEIHVINVDGSGLRRLTGGMDPDWSPDGQLIAYSIRDWDQGIDDVFVVGADGSNAQQLTDDDGSTWWMPKWSPDGTQIAFGEKRPRGSGGGRTRIWTMDADGTNPQTVLGTVAPLGTEGGGGIHAEWSPDANYLAVTDHVWDGRCAPNSTWHLVVVDLTTGERTTVDDSECINAFASWRSPGP